MYSSRKSPLSLLYEISHFLESLKIVDFSVLINSLNPEFLSQNCEFSIKNKSLPLKLKPGHGTQLSAVYLNVALPNAVSFVVYHPKLRFIGYDIRMCKSKRDSARKGELVMKVSLGSIQIVESCDWNSAACLWSHERAVWKCWCLNLKKVENLLWHKFAPVILHTPMELSIRYVLYIKKYIQTDRIVIFYLFLANIVMFKKEIILSKLSNFIFGRLVWNILRRNLLAYFYFGLWCHLLFTRGKVAQEQRFPVPKLRKYTLK